LRPESSRRASAWGETGQAPRRETDPTTEWSDPEPEWEPWPFPDEEPAEGETDGPVFVDNSGRRRRMAVLIGSAAAVVIVVAIVVLATGLSGAAPLSIPGFPDLGRPAPVVAPSPDQAQPEPGTAPSSRSTLTETPSPSRTPPGRSQSHTPPPHPTKTK
jgi:hypothetical protein